MISVTCPAMETTMNMASPSSRTIQHIITNMMCQASLLTHYHMVCLGEEATFRNASVNLQTPSTMPSQHHYTI